MDFLKDLIKEVGAEYAQIASDIKAEETFVDTGSYLFNALASGSIFGGISANKITGLVGDPGTGKSFYALAVVKNYLENNPDGYCLYFDTESAITRSLLESRGIDLKRIVIINVVTVEEFRNKALKAVDIYLKKDLSERKPCIFVLDSLGMLSTNKEITDTLAEKDTRDMTKAQLIKGAFRMLTLKFAEANIPMLVTNHVYDSMSMYSPKQISGGSGMVYSASTIIQFSKSKEKEGSDVIGAIIRAKTYKSRFSKEQQDVETRLFFDNRGLDRYYGILPLAVEGGVIERVGNRYVFGDKKFYEKEIMQDPERFFTQDILEKIDVYARKKFSYGSTLVDLEEEVIAEEAIAE